MWQNRYYEYSKLNPLNTNSKERKIKNLVIFLHGYGANGKNLIDLAHEFDYVLEDAYYISPNGVENWEGGFPDCYQWFSLQNGLAKSNINQLAESIKTSNKILADFIDQQLQKFSLTYQNLIIAGFSQGAMMAMYQGMIKKEKPAAIISFSGKLILPEMVGEKTISKPDICLIHGKADSVLPFDNFIEAEKILTENKFNFSALSFENLDHTIDIHSIRAAQNFIKNKL
jgi:phospholipase/carboxylesterase